MNRSERQPGRLAPIVLLALTISTGSVRADEPDESMFSFSGFGTLGVAHSSEDRADFVTTIVKPSGAGHTDTWSVDVDSLLAGQVTATFTPKFSAVLQVIAQQNHDDDYEPHVEWANIKYQLTPDLSIRAGRIVLPGLLLSDTRKVAYTYPFVRPPLEAYDLTPVSNSDGVDITYRLHEGEFTTTVQAHYGSTEPHLPGASGVVEAHDLWGVSSTVEYDSLTVRVAYQTTDLTIPSLNLLFDAFRQFGPEGIAIADEYDPRNTPAPFFGIGASYDPGNWFVMGDWGTTDSHSILGEKSGWYVGGGLRFGAFTPYLSYARVTSKAAGASGLTLSTLPPFLVAPATALNGVVAALQEAGPFQKTIAVGGRWDFAKNAAFKVQFDHINLGSGSRGSLINTQPGFQPGGDVTVFSTTVDFVF